ncbi:hypothetical protein PR048_026034 [Dryococelus australis]|uniref:Uncharacterized protein n=1 Tax=Dryococelus australis TaxID=614101 RepID=A0ABQ9GK76_9NEOP|nr:hypothetical protein PR048_026034 [Dryococelus australis]
MIFVRTTVQHIRFVCVLTNAHGTTSSDLNLRLRAYTMIHESSQRTLAISLHYINVVGYLLPNLISHSWLRSPDGLPSGS